MGNFEVMDKTSPYRPYYTYADYKEWDEPWELINGFAYALKPGLDILHQLIASKLTHLLMGALESVHCNDFTLIGRFDWKVSDDTVVRPDRMIMPWPISNDAYLDCPPALVVEIVTKWTNQKDRNEKFDIYQEQKVPYYLVVDARQKTIEVFQIKNGVYELVTVNPERHQFNIGRYEIEVDFSEQFEE